MELFDDIAISSRIRLARNVTGIPFYTLVGDEDAAFICQRVKKILERFDLFNFLSLKDLSLSECNALFEQHLISRELIANKDISSVAISEDEHVIIMLNEEDHIREQCIENGFNLLKPYKRIRAIDEAILNELDIAFDERLGFITASPANLGSAMRASVMLFLPALERANRIPELFELTKKHSLTIRGAYGEGSHSYASFYQISNQGSLGKSEDEIIDEVSEIIYQICEMEKLQRDKYIIEERAEIRDQSLRAYGILTNCYALEEDEMMRFLSNLKFGSVLGFLDIKDDDAFQKLFYEGASANLKEIIDFSAEKKENITRAEYISKKVKNLCRRR